MITIWFEPHSTSLDNEAKLSSGWNDVDLSELGLKQSEELVDRCADRGIEVIFCSNLQRSVKSGMPLAAKAGIPIYVDARLRECNYGDLTQKPKEEVEVEKPKRIHEPFPGGESYEQTVERMKEFLDYLKQNFDGKTVLIIGHRATQYGIDAYLGVKTLEQSLSEKWSWQPGWRYELQ